MDINKLLNRPFLILTVSVAIGILLSELSIEASGIIILLPVVIVLLSVSILLRTTPYIKILLILLIGLIVGLYIPLLNKETNETIISSIVKSNDTTRVIGTVTSSITYNQKDKSFINEDNHRQTETNNGFFYINISEVEAEGRLAKITGILKVNFYNIDVQGVKVGDTVEIIGRIKIPEKPTNPGQFDYAKYLKYHSIDAILSVSSKGYIKLIEQGSTWHIRSLLESIRLKIKQIIDDTLRPDTAGYISGLLLGYNDAISDDLNNNLRKSGTIHLLAISGLHVVILFAVCWLLLRALNIRQNVQTILLIAILLLYAALTNGEASVIRSVIMAVIFLLASIFYRKSDGINSLSISAFAILIVAPYQLFDLGFQLSFIAVLSIIYITPIFLNFLKGEKQTRTSESESIDTKRDIYYSAISITDNYIRNSLSISISAWLATAPIIASNFSIITPSIIIANILMAPIVSFQIVCAFLLSIVGLFSYTAASIPAYLIELSFKALVAISNIVVSIPFSYFYIPTPPLILTLLIFILLILWIIWNTYRPSKVKVATITIIILLLPLSLFMRQRTNGFYLAMLDVGRGNCIYIEFSDGRNILYDAGSAIYRDPGKYTIAPFLLKRGVTDIDYLILSHPDSDHINGAKSVLDVFDVKTVVVSKYFQTFEGGAELLDWINNNKHTKILIVEGRGPNPMPLLHNKDIEILAPPQWERFGYKPTSNNTSLVIRITYQGNNVLLTGDMEDSELRELTSADIDLHSTILLAPHHGKASIDTNLLAELVKPSITLVSASKLKDGQALSYSEEVISKYKEMGSQVYITAEYGATSIIINDEGITVETYR